MLNSFQKVDLNAIKFHLKREITIRTWKIRRKKKESFQKFKKRIARDLSNSSECQIKAVRKIQYIKSN